MSTEIDIYADKPTVTDEYMIAVMCAYTDGKKIQYKLAPLDRAWEPAAPVWNWADYIYRVDPSEKPKPKMVEVPMTGHDVFLMCVESKCPVWFRARGRTVSTPILLANPWCNFDAYEFTVDGVDYKPFTKMVPESEVGK